MSTTQQRPSDPFIAAIKAKIAAWQAVLEKYEAAVALDGQLGDVASVSGTTRPLSRPTVLPVGVFRDKGIKEAIPIYLAAGQRRQTNKEIAQGLQKGGIATTAQSFESAVATALSRLKDDGIVLRFPDGWDLAQSYPDSLRNRMTKEVPRAAAKSTNGKSQSSKPDATDDKTAAILRMIGLSNGLSLKEISAALLKDGIQTTPDYVRVVTKRLRKRGMIDRHDDGKWRSTMAAS